MSYLNVVRIINVLKFYSIFLWYHPCLFNWNIFYEKSLELLETCLRVVFLLLDSNSLMILLFNF